MPIRIETNPCAFQDWDGLLRLLQAAFSYMEPVISPPSSLNRMSAQDLSDKAAREDLFVARDDRHLVGCLFGRAVGRSYTIGKFAVAPALQGKGIGRSLMETAAAHAARLDCTHLDLQSRVELTQNHAGFAKLGFEQTSTFTHPGFDRPTSLIFRRAIQTA